MFTPGERSGVFQKPETIFKQPDVHIKIYWCIGGLPYLLQLYSNNSTLTPQMYDFVDRLCSDRLHYAYQAGGFHEYIPGRCPTRV